VPLYGYACPDCGKAFDVLQKFSDPPVTTCPGCGAGNVHKKLSAPAFHLKGGGWYKDHYGLKSGGGESGGGAATASAGGDAASSTPAAASASPAPAAASAPSATPSAGSGTTST
jgi:putative FmdB family regulatory protein